LLVGLLACGRGVEPAATPEPPPTPSTSPSSKPREQPATVPALPEAATAPGAACGGHWTSGPFLTAVARGSHAAELLPGDRILLVGGRTNHHDAEAAHTGIDILDLRPGQPAKVYRSAPRRLGHTLTRLADGRVALIGGTEADTPESWLPTWLYDPARDAWSFPSGPAGFIPVSHTATLLAGSAVLLAGGRRNGRPLSPPQADAVVFDLATDTTRPLPPLHTARADHTATRLPDGRVLVVGGSGVAPGPLGDAEIYDPATSTWVTLPGAAPRRAHTATLLPDGRVLLAGGSSASPAQLFDPHALRFVDAKPPPAPARSQHTATLLRSGAVLVAGGYVEGRGAIADTAIYLPASGSWCVAAPMATPRMVHTATRLEDGRVLVAGGDDTKAGAPPQADSDPYTRVTEVFVER
jgi:hypothetical protein